MSYRCNSCLYIFNSKKNNCPYCGGRIYQNSTSDEELIKDGFSYATENTLESNENQVDNTTLQSDYYTKLQEDYRNEHLSNNNKKTVASPVITSQTTVSNNTSDENSPPNDNNPSLPHQGGYFSQFTTGVTQGTQPKVPTIDRPTSSTSSLLTYHDAEYDAEMRRLEEQQRRIQRDYNKIAFSNFLHNIPRRTVMRIISIISVIIFLIFLWQMRYVILESIMNFLISLLPLAMVIGIFWYLIKSFFKK